MRIDIKAGGLDRFVSGMNSFLTDRDASSNGINSALQTISDRTGNLKGGVGALSEALGFISGSNIGKNFGRKIKGLFSRNSNMNKPNAPVGSSSANPDKSNLLSGKGISGSLTESEN